MPDLYENEWDHLGLSGELCLLYIIYSDGKQLVTYPCAKRPSAYQEEPCIKLHKKL